MSTEMLLGISIKMARANASASCDGCRTVRTSIDAPSLKAIATMRVGRLLLAYTSARLSPLLAGLALLATPAFAQQSLPLPQGLLIVDPQQGATPRLSLPQPPLTQPMIDQPVSVPSPVIAGPQLQEAMPKLSAVPYGPISVRGDQALTRGVPGGLPAPSGDPLHIDLTTDPILQLARATSPMAAFQKAISDAVAQNPALDEAIARVDEAGEVRAEARARTLPMVQVSLSTFQVLSRAFSNDPGNVLERSRPSHRTDGTLHAQQSAFDFGAGLSRIRSSQARLEAARAQVEDSGSQIALRAISAWYQVYGYRALVRLAEAFAVSQGTWRTSISDRVRQGVAATSDMAQVDGYIAASNARLADFRRQLASAEAQYAADFGIPASVGLLRAPVPSLEGVTAEALAGDTGKLPVVQAAKFAVTAARADVRALKSDRLPQVSAAIDAGRYGVIETTRDYDIRGSVTISMRLGGGAAERVGQADARLNGAEARLRRTQIEAQRDAETGLADVKALEDAQEAIETNYITSRQSRDVLAERFRVTRGTLFDLLNAESNYFAVATRYILTVIELDSARYALLARTGRLLPLLGIQPAAMEKR